MSRFWSLLEESIIVQSIITVLLVGGVLIMWLTGREVPPDLISAMMLVLGFWFGSKTQHTLSTVAQAQSQALAASKGKGE